MVWSGMARCGQVWSGSAGVVGCGPGRFGEVRCGWFGVAAVAGWGTVGLAWFGW